MINGLYGVIFTNLLVLSAAINAYQFLKIRNYKKAPPSYEARQLLHDLTAGSALVKVERVDPDSVFLRSPRDVG